MLMPLKAKRMYDFLRKEKEAPYLTAHRQYYHLHKGASTKDSSQWVKEENIKAALWGGGIYENQPTISKIAWKTGHVTYSALCSV